MLSLSAAALAFTAPAAPAVSSAARATVSMAEMSRSIPFLKQPPYLDGSMAGDRGFDPLGFSTTITELGGDLNYVREAELMHGRQAMLATVGFITPSALGKIVNFDVSTNPLEAQYQLPGAVLAQLFVFMAACEGLRSRIIFTEGGVPGEHFDEELKGKLIKTFKLETPEAMMKMKEKEISHWYVPATLPPLSDAQSDTRTPVPESRYPQVGAARREERFAARPPAMLCTHGGVPSPPLPYLPTPMTTAFRLV